MIKIIQADGTAELAAIERLAGRGAGSGEAGASEIDAAVRAIIDDVRIRGDAAVREYGEKFDGFVPERREYGRTDMKVAFDAADENFSGALLRAAENIRRYHEAQKISGYEHRDEAGNVLGQIVRGLDRVGIYVPGGTAAYPSTVLMNAIPAKIAGVGEIVMVTPPGADGVSRDILTAAWIAGVDRIIAAGGAQAVAALAYGTETIPRVDKIVGPGNVYVATAKRMVYGVVDIDMIAGPSEILVIADGGAEPKFIAADMLSQAEHDVRSAAMLVTTDIRIAERTAEEIERQLALLCRSEFARKAIRENGLIIIARSDDEAVALANLAAPEHLEIMTDDPLEALPFIRNAGSVFLGPWSPEPLGDYYAGTNHVLPTSGTARFASPLGVYDFVKRMSYTLYTEESLRRAKDDIVCIGEKEGLTAHTEAVKIRFR
ncbi:MAG: histidinol dehydrogenase [Clostridiales Family XIII bacterium]|jgi:histidinol dehydrogenase|nr:histidinol dehydrogenase [Clostridiales Family XIII bacterium]